MLDLERKIMKGKRRDFCLSLGCMKQGKVIVLKIFHFDISDYSTFILNFTIMYSLYSEKSATQKNCLGHR